MHESGGTEFRVIGVDLGAQPKDTAYCEIGVRDGTAEVTSRESDVPDERLLDVFPGAARIGIDAPFGWPIDFAAAVCMHSLSNRWPDDDPNVYPGQDKKSEDRYRNLKYRSTDLHVWKHIHKPQSAVTRSLSSLGIRNAGLLARAQTVRKLKVDRSGTTGTFVEVYPAAGLGRWKINRTDYKKNRKRQRKPDESDREFKQWHEAWLKSSGYEARATIFDKIKKTLPRLAGLDTEFRNTLLGSDHYIDAFVSALVALMVEIDPKRDQGLIEPIPPGMEAVAKREGWIALPMTCSLTCLGDWLRKPPQSAVTRS